MDAKWLTQTIVFLTALFLSVHAEAQSVTSPTDGSSLDSVFLAGATSRLTVADAVDPFSGKLGLTIPLGLPVRGLDRVALFYKHEAVETTMGASWYAPPTQTAMPFPVDWSLGWTPVLFARNTMSALGPSGSEWSMVDLDGSTEVFYGVSKTDLGGVYTGTYVSKRNWQLQVVQQSYTTQSGGVAGMAGFRGFTLTDPKGVRYVLGPTFSDSGFGAGAASFFAADLRLISFPDGRSIAFNTERLASCFDSYGAYPASARLRVVATASTGETVEFFHPGGCGAQAGDSANGYVKVNGQLWLSLQLSSGRLASVQDGAGRTTSFTYASPSSTVTWLWPAITQVSLPTGGWIKYTYRTGINYSYVNYQQLFTGAPKYSPLAYYDIGSAKLSGGSGALVSDMIYTVADVVQREVSSGLIQTYSYNRAMGFNDSSPGIYSPRYGDLDYVTVADNYGKVNVFAYYGLAYFLPTAVGLETCYGSAAGPFCGYLSGTTGIWRLASGSVLNGPELFSLYGPNEPCNTAATSGSPYCGYPSGAWKLGSPAFEIVDGDRTDYTWDSQPIQGVTRHEFVQSRIPVVDFRARRPLLTAAVLQRDGLTYTTSYEGYDAYGRPSAVREIGPGGSQRIRSISYYTDLSKNIIDRVKDESVMILHD